MRITTWAEYGLICSLHLARRAGEGPITGREIAAGERLPADYVEQILLRLRRAGLVSEESGTDDARARVYTLDRAPFTDLRGWLDEVEAFWSLQLASFKAHAERKPRRRTK